MSYFDTAYLLKCYVMDAWSCSPRFIASGGKES